MDCCGAFIRLIRDGHEHLYLDEWIRDMHQKRLINLHYADIEDDQRWES